MPLAQMLAGASNRYVSALLSAGAAYRQVLSRLARRYSGETLGEISRAASAGLRAWRAAEQMQRAGAQGQADPLQVPPGQTAGQGYRYYSVAQIADPVTGQTYSRTVEVYSPSSLTTAALAADVLLILQGALPLGRGRGRSPTDPIDFIPVSLDILAVERA